MMRHRSAGLNPSLRTYVVAAVAFASTIVTAFASYSGVLPTPTATPTPTTTPTPTPTATPTPPTTPTPTPPLPCDMACWLDKKCSVGGGPFQDSCVANAGDEVTYRYEPFLLGGYALVEVRDDKLGLIGQSSGEYLYKMTTLTETTTNYAEMELIEIQPECICLGFDPYDAVTVTVVSPTPTPTLPPTPTPTPTATPTLAPPSMTCSRIWPRVEIVTIGKGQSPTNNTKLSHAITGHLIEPASLGETAHRIEVCAGTRVQSAVTDATGTPTNTASGSLTCDAGGCSGVVLSTEKYQSVSEDGRDKDAITFIPK